MKIAFAIRADYLMNRGGDTYQFLKTKEYLEEYEDIEIVVINSVDEFKKTDCQLIHIFNIQTDKFTLAMVQEAKKRGIKVVLSPIIWELGDARYVNICSKFTTNFYIICGMKVMGNFVEKALYIFNKKKYKEILELCDLILPNSDEEGEYLLSTYNSTVKSISVPNCIDIKMQSNLSSKNLPKNMVLEVARIEPTKNQLGVVLALMDEKDIPLYFVGKQNDCHKKYIKKVKALAEKRGNTFFIEEMPQEKLIEYYKAAKVHVLPSFRESPGLVSLEAMYYDANIVVADKRYRPTKYYQFDKYGYVCNPYSVKSIKETIMDAYNTDKRIVEKEYFKFINYKKAAELTRNGYISILRN